MASAATPVDLAVGDKFTINSDEAAELDKRGLAETFVRTKATKPSERAQEPLIYGDFTNVA